MKRLSIFLIILCGMSFINIFSLSEIYPTDKAFTGGGRTITGTYVKHKTTFKPGGMWEGTTTTCTNSQNVCFTRTNGVGFVEYDFNTPLIDEPLPNYTIINAYHSYPNSNDSIVDTIIDTYFHVNP